MDDSLKKLLDPTCLRRPSPEERSEQTFENALANGALSDPRITRETMLATATLKAQAEKP